MKKQERPRWQQSPPVLALAALVLTVGVVATTPLALARYVTTATVSASARVAKFSFVATTAQHNGLGGDKEIATAPGVSSSNDFTIPLFDNEYYSAMWAISGTKSVESYNGDPVIAPGVGHAWGPLANNPNFFIHTGYGGHGNGGVYLTFDNKSEVAVRFKLEYLGSSNLQNVSPIIIRPCTVPSSSLLQPGDTEYIEPVWFTAGSSDQLLYDWIELAPNEKITSAANDPKRVGIAWAWHFNNGDDSYDTDLGKNHWNDWLEVKFRITVEQVD